LKIDSEEKTLGKRYLLKPYVGVIKALLNSINVLRLYKRSIALNRCQVFDQNLNSFRHIK